MILNCIIVDDEKASVVAMSSLVDHNSNLNLVGTASSGEEALKLFNERRIDLILLDVMMPSMSGFEFLDEIADADEDVKVILVTGKKEFAVKAFDYAITDYLVKPVSRHRFKQAVNRILNSVTGRTASDIPNNLMLLKLIKFMYTRGMEVLEPVPSRKNLLGYSFAMLTDNLDYIHEANALNILQDAENNEILSGKFIDTIYLCNSCSNSYLHIRETCPNCDSAHLETSDLIHHFSCAFMGEEDKFKSTGEGDTLVCPKCKKKLKHIGVDYDKPSAIFNCKNCDNFFQDPLLRAKCLNCGGDQKVEHLVKREIKKYHLTAKGKNIAQGNHFMKMNKSDAHLMDQGQNKEYFIRALKSEINRKTMAEFESSVGIFRLSNIEELYQQLGNMARKELKIELQEMFTNVLASGDEITFWDHETILMLFPEQNEREAEKNMGMLKDRMKQLLKDNFSGFLLELEEATHPISEDVNYDKLINVLLEKAAQSKA